MFWIFSSGLFPGGLTPPRRGVLQLRQHQGAEDLDELLENWKTL